MSSNNNTSSNNGSGGGFMGRLWGANANTGGAGSSPGDINGGNALNNGAQTAPQRVRSQRTPIVSAASASPASNTNTAPPPRRDFRSPSNTQDDTVQPPPSRPIRQRPPSTYGGLPSNTASGSGDAPSPSAVNPTPRRERPDRETSMSGALLSQSSEAQTNKERDIARRHQFRQEQLRALREREDAEDASAFAKTSTLVGVVETPVNVVVIPGYGNDDDYVLEYLSASASEGEDGGYEVEEYSSNGAQKQKKRKPQKVPMFAPNHREGPLKPAIRRAANRKRNSGGALRNRISYDGAAKQSSLTGRSAGSSGGARPMSVATPRSARPGPRGSANGRGAGAASGEGVSGDADDGEVGWDDVYEPSSPSSASGSLNRAASTSRPRRPTGAAGADPSKGPPARINSTGSSSSIEDDVGMSSGNSFMNDALGAVANPKDEDKMPEDREARREWLKRRQQARAAGATLATSTTGADSPPLRNLPDLTVQTGKEAADREARRQEWLKRKQAGSVEDARSPSSSGSAESPQRIGIAPTGLTARTATDAEIMSVLSPNSRLSNSALPTEFVLALDAEKNESNRLRQLLAAKESELSRLKLDNKSEIKRVSLLNISTNNEQLSQLEMTNEDLKSKISELEFKMQQVSLELESNKASLENEIKYRAQEREQSRAQLASVSVERDSALKEAAGKSVVLGSTEMIVNQTTKELHALRISQRELASQLEERDTNMRTQTQQIAETEEKLKRAMTEVQNRSALVRNTEERLRGLIKEMGNARAREADLMRKLQENEARLQVSVSTHEEFKNVSAENMYKAKTVEEGLRIEVRDLQNQLQQSMHGSRLRDDEIKKNRELIQGMAGRIGAMDRDIGNAKNVINERDQRIGAMTRDLANFTQREKDLLSQINLLKQSHGGEMAAALEMAENHQRDLEKLRDENSDLSGKLSTALTSVRDLEAAKKNLEENVVSLNNRISLLDGELATAHALADDTIIKIRNLTDEIAKAAARERKLIDDGKQMQTRFMELDSIAQRLVADRDAWRGRATELEKLLDQSRRESSENAVIKENLEKELRNEIANQQRNVGNAVADGTKVALQLKEVIAGLEAKVASLTQRSTDFETKSNQLGLKLAASIQNEKYLAEQIQVLKEARGGDQQAALERMEKNQQELQAIIEERNGLQVRLAELETVLQSLVADRDAWRNRAENLQSEFESTVAAYQASTEEMEKKHGETLDVLANKLKTLESEKEMMNTENSERIANLEAEVAAANELRVNLESEISALKAKLFEALNNDHEATVAALKQTIKNGEDAQEALKADIAELFETIKTKEHEKEELQANISELEETIDELMIDQEGHDKKVAKLQAALKKAKTELVDVERTTDASITHLRDEAAFGVKRVQDEANRNYWNIRVAVNALTAAIMQTEKRYESEEMSTNALVELEVVYDDLKACRQRALEWIVQVGVAGNEADAASQNLIMVKNQITSLQKQLADAKRDLDQAKTQLDQDKDADTRQRQQIKILEQQAEKLTKQKDDAEKRAMSSSTESEEIILALQQEIISIRGELAKKSEILKRTTPAEIQELLKTGETELTDARNAAAAAERELRALQRSIQEYEGLISKLQSDFESLEKQFTESQVLAKQESDSSKEQIEALKGQVTVERESLLEAQEAILNCQNMIRDLETLRNEMLQKFGRQLDEKEAAYNKCLADLDAVNAEVEELKYDVEDLEGKLAGATANADTLETNYQSVKDEIELLRNQRRESLEAMQSMIQSLQIRLQEEQDFMENSQKEWSREREDHLDEISTLQAGIQERENLVQKLTASSIDSSEELQKVLNEVTALKAQLEEKERSFTEARSEATINLNAAQTEIERLKTELSLALESHAVQKASFDAEIESLRAEKKSLEGQLITAQEKLSQHISASANEVDKGTAGTSELQETIALLNSQKAAVELETTSLRHAVTELQSKLSEISAQLELKVSDHIEVEKELASSRSAASSLESALREATEKLGNVSSGSENVDAKLNTLKEILQDKDTQLSNLQSQLSDLERIKPNLMAAEVEVSRLSILLVEAESKVSSFEVLSAKLEVAESQVARLEGQLATLNTQTVDSPVEQVKALQAQVDALKASSADIVSTQTALEAANMEVASFKQQIAAASDSIDELNKVKSELVRAESELDRLRSEMGAIPVPSDVTDEIVRLKAELEVATLSVKELEELKSKLMVFETEVSRLQMEQTELRASLLDDFEKSQLSIKSSLDQALQEKDNLASELLEIKKRLVSTNHQSGPESPATSPNGSPQPTSQAEKRGSSSDISLPLSPNSAGSPKSLIGRLWGSK